MTKILSIDSSIFGEGGQSSQLNKRLIEGLMSKHDDATLIQRNLADGSLPHFDANTVKAIGEGKADLADALISELETTDLLVISAPMYNFSIPSQLKSWFDHITRAGRTFKYTDKGPLGLLTKRPVVVISTRGGEHKSSNRDHVAPFLNTILGFVGLDQDLHYVYAEGLSQSAKRDTALEQAQQQIDTLITTLV